MFEPYAKYIGLFTEDMKEPKHPHEWIAIKKIINPDFKEEEEVKNNEDPELKKKNEESIKQCIETITTVISESQAILASVNTADCKETDAELLKTLGEGIQAH